MVASACQFVAFVKATKFFFADYKEFLSQAEVTVFANIIVWFTFPYH